MRKVLFLFFLVLTYAPQVSAESINAMILWMSSGNQIVCMLDEEPVISFEGDDLVLTTHMNVVKYNSDDVLRFTFSSVSPAGVDELKLSMLSFSFDGYVIKASNLEPLTEVHVFSVDGVQLTTKKTDHKGNVTISLPSQRGGVYVIKSSVANFKISKP